MFDIIENSGDLWWIHAISFIVVIVLSLSLHEFAHAFAAYKCGDNTGKMEGRLTLNPLNHMDPIGFICCVFFKFGWAKPVPVNPANFRNYKKGSAWTSVAGVLMNLFLAFIGYGLFCVVSILPIPYENLIRLFFLYFFLYLFMINISLAVFNFLPIYPLDGFRFVETFAKYDNGYVTFMRKYGSIVLLAVVFLLGDILSHLISIVQIPIMLFWNLIF